MKKSYHTINKQGNANEQKLAEFLSRNGQMLLPMVDLVEQCQWACDELIDVTGRAAIQAVLQLSAEQAHGRAPVDLRPQHRQHRWIERSPNHTKPV